MSYVSIITGITGQDGSYLAELLLEAGHQVYGLIRRSSSFNTARIEHIYSHPNLKLIYADLSDSSSVGQVIGDIKPDYLYNLAAQSHVRVSFDIPEYTYDVTGMGVLRCLEAIHKFSPNTRFYQASSSELFGSTPPPQNEITPFHPRSPYAVAKLMGYWTTVNYRESYGIFASNGILFNHESIPDFMPVIFKEGKNGHIQIKPICEFVNKHLSSTRKINLQHEIYQEFEPDRKVYVWDKDGWTKVKCASAYPSFGKKDIKYVISKNAAYATTEEHKIIMQDGSEKERKDICIGDKVSLLSYPNFNSNISDYDLVSTEEAELLGFIVGDGSHTKDFSSLSFSGKDLEMLKYFEDIWNKLGGSCTYKRYKTVLSKDEGVWRCDLNSNNSWIKQFKIYDDNHKKMIPWQILNSEKNIMESFLRGYMKADGLKAVPLNYEYKGFCTNSATLAAGLLFLLSKVTGQNFNINIDASAKWRNIERYYYRINILSDAIDKENKKYAQVKQMIEDKVAFRKILFDTGINVKTLEKINKGYNTRIKHHKEIENDTVKKILPYNYDGWLYDIETDSGTFHCGIGVGQVHNSPCRGETFVTRKITRAVGRIKYELQNELRLGNLEAKRDWAHAKDYVVAQKLILEYEHPDDFVVATGEAHSVREFAEKAFAYVGLDPYKYIVIDPKYYRPAEVDYLLGDSSKARKVLGWEPKISFEELVKEMVDHDMELARRETLVKNTIR